MSNDNSNAEPVNKYRTRLCIFCEKPAAHSANGRGKACADHLDLIPRYNVYKHTSINANAYIMTPAEFLAYKEGSHGMICVCEVCGEKYELLDKERCKGVQGRRTHCDRHFKRKKKAKTKARSTAKTARNKNKKHFTKPPKRSYGYPVLKETYASAPEEWGLAEFMAGLEHNGAVAREFLEERGYRVDVNRPGLPEKSPLQSAGVRFQV